LPNPPKKTLFVQLASEGRAIRTTGAVVSGQSTKCVEELDVRNDTWPRALSLQGRSEEAGRIRVDGGGQKKAARSHKEGVLRCSS